MNILEDRRPTLASWPRRMYDWSEVPVPFQAALAGWNAAGMPPGNITLIPRIHQHSGAPEYAAAWFDGEVCLQRMAGGRLDVWRIRPGDVAQVGYSVQLIKCTVTVRLKEGGRAGFSYNKTKEDQLYPVLSLLLGQPAGRRPPLRHPDASAFAQLLQESYAMYYTSLLAYRFGGRILDHIFLRGKHQNLLYLLQRRPDPECFCAMTDAGLVCILTDFYGTSALYMPKSFPCSLRVKPLPRGKGSGLYLHTLEDGEHLYFHLLPGQEGPAGAFARRWFSPPAAD
ncbi:MAG TPA: hypothetical protein H9770_00960 [Candidatus Fournierella excrementigallinarum]|nr:hypothetical protein [Candidatus Fournierella excrementigallinarum]